MKYSLKPGDVFGSRTVIGDPYWVGKHSYVMAHCSCGNASRVLVLSLVRGKCQKCSRCSKPGLRHGGFTKDHIAPEYRVWVGLRYRCSNPNARNWHLYGGRGIKVCGRWQNSFENFLADVGPRPSLAHSIDRIDNNGDYAPGNVRWATASEQQSNTRANRIIEYQGRRQTITQWAREFGLGLPTLCWRLRKGWSLEKAFTEPVRPY